MFKVQSPVCASVRCEYLVEKGVFGSKKSRDFVNGTRIEPVKPAYCRINPLNTGSIIFKPLINADEDGMNLTTEIAKNAEQKVLDGNGKQRVITLNNTWQHVTTGRVFTEETELIVPQMNAERRR